MRSIWLFVVLGALSGAAAPSQEGDPPATFGWYCSECPPFAVVPRGSLDLLHAPVCGEYGDLLCLPGPATVGPGGAHGEVFWNEDSPPGTSLACLWICMEEQEGRVRMVDIEAEESIDGFSCEQNNPPPGYEGCTGPIPWPWYDGDEDGEHYLEDSDETSNPPFTEDHPLFQDSDDDGLPDLLDVSAHGGDGGPIDSDGLLPRDLDADGLRRIMDGLGVDLSGLVSLPALTDLNDDGALTIGDAIQALLNEAIAKDATLRDPDNPERPVGDALAAAWHQIASLWDAGAHLADAAGYTDLADDLWEAAAGAAGLAERVEILIEIVGDALAAMGLLTANDTQFTVRFVPGEDDSFILEVVFLDSDGNPIELGEGQAEFLKVDEGISSRAGDPVDTASGGFFHEKLDLVTMGRGIDLRIRRIYHSRSSRLGVLGYGWSMPVLETALFIWPGAQPFERMAEVFWGDGNRSYYRQDPQDTNELFFVGIESAFGKIRAYENELGEEPDCGMQQGLNRGLVLRQPDGTEYYFCPPAVFVTTGGMLICWLRKVTDLYGNSLTIQRNEWGDVTELFDTLGRAVTFEYDDETHLLSSMTDWSGRRWDYLQDPTTFELIRVDYPETTYMSSTSAMVEGRPFDAYEYWGHPTGWPGNPQRRLLHNLKRISNGEDGETAFVEYFTDASYSFDKVSQVTVDGQVTRFLYQPSFDPLQPKIKHLTSVRHPEGEVEKYSHGKGLLYRKEVLNGRYDTDWEFLYTLDPDGPSAWWTIYDYNGDSQMVLLEV